MANRAAKKELNATKDGKDLSMLFLKRVYSIPGGEKIKTCIQCGTCSGSCPTSHIMDYTPREIIAALREGMLDKVLKSNTVWMCTSCYYCTVRCPQNIKFTDIMYELKRLGVKYGYYPEKVYAPALSKSFVKMVDKYGRNPEPELLMRYYMKTRPWGIFKIFPLGWKLLLRGRVSLRPKKITGSDDLQKILDRLYAKEA